MLVWVTGAAAAAAAALACLRASRLASARGSRAWRAQSSAALAWAGYALLRGAGAPDLVATVVWVAFAVLVGQGMWLTSRGADPRGRTRMLLDALTAAASALVVLWTAVSPAWVADARPVTDAGLLLRPVVAVGLCVLYVLVLLSEIRPGRRGMPVLLVCSMAATAVTEAGWAWGPAVAGAGPAPGGSSVGHLATPLLVLAAAVVYRGTSRRLARPPTASRAVALAPFVLLVPAGVALGSQAVAGGHLDAVQGWSVAALVLLVLLRQGVTGAENRDLVHRLWQSEERLRHQATHDRLTGLPDRSLLAARLEAVVGSSRPAGLLVLDLDGFKEVNDRWGHAAGDELLRQAAARLRAGVREGDLAARTGGDEFAVVVGDGRAVMVAERLRAALSRPFALDGHQVDGVSASIGVALARPGDAGGSASGPEGLVRRAEELLHRADTAMYAAKRRGGDRVVVEDGALDGPAAEDPAAEDEVLDAPPGRDGAVRGRGPAGRDSLVP